MKGEQKNILSCHEIVKKYGEKTVLDMISICVPEGLTTGIVAVSGSGKSTLGRILLGLEPVTSGKVWYTGKALATWLREDEKTFRREVQILFQFPYESLFPYFTIREALQEIYDIHPELSSYDERHCINQLQTLGLSDIVLNRYPHQLSGGQIQRVCLARLLLLKPKIIVLDEATTMLDPTSQKNVIDLLKSVQKKEGVGYLFVSHDLNLLRYMTDFLYVIDKGRIVEEGDTAIICDNPQSDLLKALVLNKNISKVEGR